MSDENLTCSFCFNSISIKELITCSVCKRHFHNFCINLKEEYILKSLSLNKNVVYNCNKCLISSNELISTVSALSIEVKELKSLLIELLNNAKYGSTRTNSQSAFNLNAKISGLDDAFTKQQKNVPAQVVDKNSNGALDKSCIDIGNSSGSPISQSVFDNAAVTDGDRVLNDVVDVVVSENNTQDNRQSLALVTNVTSLPSANIKSNANINVYPSTSSAASLNNDLHSGAGWTNVVKRKNKNKKRKVIVGQSNNSELDVIVQRKWVHLSSFKPTVTEDNIKMYVAKRIKINIEDIACFRLIKKDVNLEDVKKLNFKLGVSSEFYNELFDPRIWPSNIKVRHFKNFQKPSPDLPVK